MKHVLDFLLVCMGAFLLIFAVGHFPIETAIVLVLILCAVAQFTSEGSPRRSSSSGRHNPD